MAANNVRAVLCASTEEVRHPELLGLPDENLADQGWLAVMTDAERARSWIKAHGRGLKVWIAGSDDVCALNLAAAVRADGGAVQLVAFHGSGSLASRARAAGVSDVLDEAAFLQAYGTCKQAALLQDSLARTKESTGPIDLMLRERAAKAAEQDGDSTAVPLPSSAPARVQKASASERPSGTIVSVVGAGGGTGKSTVAVLLAVAVQQRGLSTAIVDADLQCGDVRYLMGADHALGIDELAAQPERASSLSSKSRLPAVVASPEKLEASEELAGQVAGVVRDLANRFDAVVVNTGPAWGDVQMDLIGLSDQVIFVLDQRPTSIRLCRHVLELCARCGAATKQFLFAVNRWSKQALFSGIDVAVALGAANTVELSDGGKAVQEYLGSGQPLDVADAHNPLYLSLAKLAMELFPESGGAAPVAAQAPVRRGLFRSRRRKEAAACL